MSSNWTSVFEDLNTLYEAQNYLEKGESNALKEQVVDFANRAIAEFDPGFTFEVDNDYDCWIEQDKQTHEDVTCVPVIGKIKQDNLWVSIDEDVEGHAGESFPASEIAYKYVDYSDKESTAEQETQRLNNILKNKQIQDYKIKELKLDNFDAEIDWKNCDFNYTDPSSDYYWADIVVYSDIVFALKETDETDPITFIVKLVKKI